MRQTLKRVVGKMEMTATEIVAIITGVGGLIAGVIAAMTGARKDEIAALRETLDSLAEENDRLRKRMMELEVCVNASEKTIDVLTEQVNDWKRKYDQLNLDWQIKYTKLQAEFDNLKRSMGV